MRNAKGVTHTGYVRGAMFHNEEVHVLFFTGMSLEDLFNLKADMGRRWITWWGSQPRGEGLPALLTEAEAADLWECKEIMQVWNLQWRRTDHYTIVPILHKVQPGEAENVYKDMHLNAFVKGHPDCLWLEISMMQALRRIIQAGEKFPDLRMELAA